MSDLGLPQSWHTAVESAIRSTRYQPTKAQGDAVLEALMRQAALNPPPLCLRGCNRPTEPGRSLCSTCNRDSDLEELGSQRHVLEMDFALEDLRGQREEYLL